MARIKTYEQDSSLNVLDKFLGTDSATDGTKNFTIQSVIDLIDEGGLISQPISISYDFGVYDEDVAAPEGILTLGTGNPAAGNFSDITEILLSKTDKNGNDVESFIDSLTNYNIRISPRGQSKSPFGVFKITAIADVDDNNDQYIKLTLTHVNSSGAISDSGKYHISVNPIKQVQSDWNATSGDAQILNKPTNLVNTSSSVTSLSDVSSVGSGQIITADERITIGQVGDKALAATTITVQGTTNEVTVSPDTAQDLSANRTVTIGLPDDVTIGDDLTVTNKVNLGGPMEFTGIESTTPTFDNGIYYVTEDGHDTLHFRYHGHDLSIDHLTENVPTGILNGGVLSKANSTQFTITAGNGVINILNKSNSDPHPEIKQVSWSQQTITVSNLDSNETDQLNSWIYIDNTGTVQQQATPLTDAQKRSNILIGSAIHSEGVLKFVKTFPLTGYNNMSQISEFIQTFGPMKKSGHTVSANGANLSIDRASGVAFALGRNYANDAENPSTVSDAAKTTCVIHRYYGDGSNGFVLDDGASGNGYTTLDVGKYDDGSGTLANVSGGHFSVQRLYYFPGTPNIVIAYYGRDEYNSMDTAENNYLKENFVEANNTAEQAIYLGAVIVKGGATALNATADAKFLTAGTFRSLAAVNVGGAIASETLNDLNNVSISSVANGHVLKYNSTSTNWENVSDSIDPISLDDTNNRVGINSTSPAVALEVKNTETASSSKILSIQDNSNNERLIVRNDGKVGIKTATPTHDLHVTGTANITSNTTLGGTLSITGAVTASSTIAATGNVTGANLNISNWDTAYGWGDHSTAGYLTAHPTISGAASSSDNSGQVFIQDITLDSNGHVTGLTTATAGSLDGTGAANKIAIWSDSDTLTNDTNFHWDSTNDRLGIGTSSPTKDLTISKNGGATILVSAGTAGSANIELTPNTTGSGTGKIYTTNTLDLTLGVNSSDKVTIKNDGKVGIGTSSPSEKLHVSGKVQGSSFVLDSTTALEKYYASTVMKIPSGNYLYLSSSTLPSASSLESFIAEKIALGKTTAPSASLDIGSHTDAIIVPKGTDAQRDALTAVSGMFRFNTTDNEFEGYDGTEWGAIGGGGGIVTVERNSYTGDGSDLTFDTTSTIDNENNVQVYVDGVYQSKTKYSTSGSTVTFGSGNAPANGSAVELIHHKGDTGATIAADAIDTTQITDGAVTYPKLDDEFKTRAANTTLSSSTTSTTLDFSSKAVFEVTLPADSTNITLNFANAKIGMTKVVIVKTQSTAHSGTISFDVTNASGGALTGTGTFTRLSSDDITKDASTTNYMQITCIDEGSDAGDRTFIYTVGTAQT